jgi:SAM-dependent methyltransferase
MLNNENISLGFGIDPLVKTQYNSNKLYLLKAIGESLPFQNEFFNHISFATSFDHVINHVDALWETIRVLRQGGRLIFWVNSEQESQSILSKGINKIRIKLRPKQSDQSVLVQQEIVDSMEIPQGAVDKFHLIHITDKGLKEMIKAFPLRLIEEKKIIGSTFLKYEKLLDHDEY